jgi:hypothetical protein
VVLPGGIGRRESWTVWIAELRESPTVGVGIRDGGSSSSARDRPPCRCGELRPSEVPSWAIGVGNNRTVCGGGTASVGFMSVEVVSAPGTGSGVGVVVVVGVFGVVDSSSSRLGSPSPCRVCRCVSAGLGVFQSRASGVGSDGEGDEAGAGGDGEEEDAFAAVGGADVGRANACPVRVIPDFGQVAEYGVQAAAAPAQGGDVLQDEQAGS